MIYHNFHLQDCQVSPFYTECANAVMSTVLLHISKCKCSKANTYTVLGNKIFLNLESLITFIELRTSVRSTAVAMITDIGSSQSLHSLTRLHGKSFPINSQPSRVVRLTIPSQDAFKAHNFLAFNLSHQAPLVFSLLFSKSSKILQYMKVVSLCVI